MLSLQTKKRLNGAKRSKTMWLALILVVLGALMDSSIYLQALLEPKYFSMFMLVLAVVLAVLRFRTTKPLDDL